MGFCLIITVYYYLFYFIVSSHYPISVNTIYWMLDRLRAMHLLHLFHLLMPLRVVPLDKRIQLKLEILLVGRAAELVHQAAGYHSYIGFHQQSELVLRYGYFIQLNL